MRFKINLFSSSGVKNSVTNMNIWFGLKCFTCVVISFTYHWQFNINSAIKLYLDSFS